MKLLGTDLKKLNQDLPVAPHVWRDLSTNTVTITISERDYHAVIAAVSKELRDRLIAGKRS